MSGRAFAQLQDVLLDPDFPALDLALRRGRHIDREDAAWYGLLIDAQEQLEALYRRYGCELIYKNDGYFFLLPTSDSLPKRQLASGDMLVGQALALLYLDPASVERGGLVTREQVIEQLVSVVGTDALIGAFLPKRRRQDEQVTQRLVRNKIAETVRRLANLGFAELQPDDHLRLRPALLRFAEPVRGLAEPAEALAQLISQGEVALTDPDAPDVDSDDDADEDVVVDTDRSAKAALAGPAEADSGDEELPFDNALVESAESDPGEVELPFDAELEDAADLDVRKYASSFDAALEDAAEPDSGEFELPFDRGLDDEVDTSATAPGEREDVDARGARKLASSPDDEAQ